MPLSFMGKNPGKEIFPGIPLILPLLIPERKLL